MSWVFICGKTSWIRWINLFYFIFVLLFWIKTSVVTKNNSGIGKLANVFQPPTMEEFLFVFTIFFQEQIAISFYVIFQILFSFYVWTCVINQLDFFPINSFSFYDFPYETNPPAPLLIRYNLDEPCSRKHRQNNIET